MTLYERKVNRQARAAICELFELLEKYENCISYEDARRMGELCAEASAAIWVEEVQGVLPLEGDEEWPD